MLKAEQGILGGETSGHLLCLDKATTGDGLINGLQVLAVMRRTGKSLKELAAGMTRFPQTLLNVRVKERIDPDTKPQISAAVAAAETELGERGRVVLRASGTEPVIRVMVEGDNPQQVGQLADRLAEVVHSTCAA
jgi:phosphoglucosamine mutase